MVVHCEKHGDQYFFCHEIHTLRREEDRELEHELERELLRLFPDELRAVRLIREDEDPLLQSR